MTEQNPFLDDDSDPGQGQDQSGSALRKFGQEQKKRADDLAKELADIRSELAKRQASDIFGKLGISEKIRKFYSGEPTEESITAWWKENASVFGVELGADDPTQTAEQKQTHADLGAVQSAQGLGQERGDAFSPEAFATARKNLLSTKGATTDDLDEVLRKFGVPDVPMMAPQF